MQKEKRIGRFTSSEIHKLFGNWTNGKPSEKSKKYIDQIAAEQVMGRSLNSEGSKATTWGQVMEYFAISEFGLEEFHNRETFKHPKYLLSGTPDVRIPGDAIFDIKCPYSLERYWKEYCCKTGEELKKAFPEYYWQVVSNAFIENCNKCSLYVYVPRESDVESVKSFLQALEIPEEDKADVPLDRVYNLFCSSISELPILPNNAMIGNKHLIEWVVPQEDFDRLEKTLQLAESYLPREIIN